MRWGPHRSPASPSLLPAILQGPALSQGLLCLSFPILCFKFEPGLLPYPLPIFLDLSSAWRRIPFSGSHGVLKDWRKGHWEASSGRLLHPEGRGGLPAWGEHLLASLKMAPPSHGGRVGPHFPRGNF
jgi:hypothetical protein